MPSQVITNDDIARRLDTSDEWIRSRTGIGERRVLASEQATSDMAAEAGRRACEAAGLALSDIDCLIVATATPDMPMPSCAMLTQHKLGARGPAFDLNAACAGFSYGTTVADGMLRSGLFRRIMFIGAEAFSRFLDWDDRGTCILFGDGAGAVIMAADRQDAPEGSPAARGILACHIDGDGAGWPDLNILGGGTKHPPSPETIANRMHYLRMNGRVIFSQAVRHLSDSSEKALEKAGLHPGAVDLVIPHQANLRILDAVARRMNIEQEKFIINLDRYGNTSSASIPIALDETVRSGRLRDGMVLLHCGLGAGLAWGAVVVRW